MYTFKVVLYLSAIFTCLACTILLFRHYLRQRLRLLLWSALCFVGLTINNLFLFIDLVMFPAVDLRPIRLLAALIGLCLLLFGFIWEGDS
jgi:hypothetical protein